MLAALAANNIPVQAEEGFVDSGMNYEESVSTINNPGAGYTKTLWYRCTPGETAVQNPSGNLVLMFVDIGAFSSGVNGTSITDNDGNVIYTEGKDYDLDEQFFQAMRGTLENCRKNGSTVALRFRYDANGKTNPEPASFDQVLHHIDQIKENGFLEDYKDILMFVESGFVGAWGEQHSGKYTSLEDKAKLLDAVLDLVPEEVPVTVRTPNIFAKWAGIDMKNIADWVSESGSDAERIGLYNDGYMGSDSDLGTFSNRENETTWLGKQTLHTYYGGEFSGNLDWAKKYTTYLPENAIPEMYKTHLSYINSNVYKLYQDYTFGKEYDVSGADNSAYYGQNVYQFIRDHIGYRFVIRNCELEPSAEQGESFKLNFQVENTGFANPIRPQKAEILLEKDGNYTVQEIDLDSREWYSCTTSEENVEISVPGNLEAGEWNVYLRLSVGNQSISEGNLRTVQFANPDIWNASLGANRLATVEIKETNQPENKTNHLTNVYTTGNQIIFDGIRSSETEWTEKNCIAQNENNKLYLSADDKYLYVAAEILHNVEKPVWNLRIEHDEDSYWIYYQSAGWCYYSKGEDHSGFNFKKNGNFAEFQIDMQSMNMKNGTNLDKVRMFVQDEGNEWKNMGDITAENLTLSGNLPMFSAYQTISLKENQNYSLQAETPLENVSYTWLKDGEIIPEANGKTFTLNQVNADAVGEYSVKLTTENGMTQEFPLYKIETVYPSENNIPSGDVNADGIVDVKDIKALQNYLLNAGSLQNWENADMNGNQILEIFDLVLLKRLVLTSAT